MNVDVSVYCLAYNHEKYIKKTLDGFVNQTTNFTYEVIVHDDCSTDNTASIIKAYAIRYPDIIKPIFQKENKYSKNENITKKYIIPNLSGRYIAICEGDDYWSDNLKLQYQYNALQENKKCSFSTHKTQCVNVDGDFIGRSFPPVKLEQGRISGRTYIENELVEHPWLFQTSSYFIRREVFEECINTMTDVFPVGDLPLVLLASHRGDCFFIDKYMSCYRVDAGGLMAKLRDNTEYATQFYDEMIVGLKEYDEYTANAYHEIVSHAIGDNKIKKYKITGQYKKIFSDGLTNNFMLMNVPNKFLIVFGCVFPSIARKLYTLYHSNVRNG